jgi:hypothetical protein
MSKKNKNPYRSGSAYAGVFEALRKAGQKGITRQALLEADHAVADVTVVLSPRAEGSSTRGGDPRGNLSSQGHLYYVDKRKSEGEPARFVLRWRKNALDRRVRPLKKIVKAKKSKAKAKQATKAKAKATAKA